MHRQFRAIFRVLLNLTLLAAVSVHGVPSQNILYVKHNATGNNDGSSWDDAYTDLQDALGAVEASDEVWVAEGVYYPADDAVDRNATFELQDGVGLYGGFAGTETERDQRDWKANVTVLSGDLDRNDATDENGVVTDATGILGRNAYHVVTAEGVDGTTLLDGFTVTAGLADGTEEYGGGMYIESADVSLANVTLSGNRAVRGGGICTRSDSSPTLTNVTLSGNRADRGGGMMNVVNNNPALTNVTFIGNHAESYGGGMYNWDYTNARLTDVTFRGNTAEFGGGMYNRQYNDPTITNVTFISNYAEYYGGGLCNRVDNSPKLTNVQFTGNQARHGGGMCNRMDNNNPTLTNVTFSGNQADQGGGMYSQAGDINVVNAAFSGNRANEGGGMYNQAGDVTLLNVTFAANRAESTGGALYNQDSSPVLGNSVLWGNAAVTSTQIHNEGTSAPFVMYSNIEGGYSGEGNINSDPLFVAPVAASSAPTTTGNYRLTQGSPVIDMGANDVVTVATDLDGNPRILDGDGDTNAIVDMGAYEFQVPLVTIIKQGQGVVISTRGSIDCGSVCSAGFLTGTSVALSAIADPGWSFQDWSGDIESMQNPLTLTVEHDTAITATFSQDDYTLDANIVGQGAVTKGPDEDVYHYGDVVTLTATADPGWTFQSWSGDVDSTNNPLELVVGANTAITATFRQDKYMVDVTSIGEGDVDVDPEQVTYIYGDVLTLTAIAQPAWSFDGWSGDVDSTDNPLTLTVRDDIVITATFKVKAYLPLVLANQ